MTKSPSIAWIEQNVSSDSPMKRFGVAASRSKSSIYIHGGAVYNDKRKLEILNDLYEIQVGPDTNFELLPLAQQDKCPEARFLHHLCIYKDHLYLFGGTNQVDGQVSLPGTFVYNTGSNMWLERKVSGAESRTIGSSASQIGAHVFVFGGQLQGRASAELWLFDARQLEWTVLEACGDVPHPRCDHSAAVVGTSVFICGGTSGPDTFYADLFRLDTLHLTWEEIQARQSKVPLLIPRAGHTITAHHTKDLYVFGGYNDHLCPNGAPVQSSLIKFSTAHKTWKEPSLMKCSTDEPEPTFYHAAIIMNNRLLVFGGMNAKGNAPFLKVARIFNPSERQEDSSPRPDADSVDKGTLLEKAASLERDSIDGDSKGAATDDGVTNAQQELERDRQSPTRDLSGSDSEEQDNEEQRGATDSVQAQATRAQPSSRIIFRIPERQPTELRRDPDKQQMDEITFKEPRHEVSE